MGMWAMHAAPLLAGNNLSQLTPEVTAILTNREVIAIDQDRLGRQGDRVFAEGPVEVWSRPLADGGRAVAVFNFGEDETFLLGITPRLRELLGSNSATDVWAGKPVTVDASSSLKRHASLV